MDNEFARRNDCLISEHAFWLAVALAVTVCASSSAQTATYIGSTTVSAGALTIADSSGSALGSTSTIIINSSGTLLLAASNQIDDSATMKSAGGTFAKGSYSGGMTNAVGIGALTLTAPGSHIDFGTDTVGVLSYASCTSGANAIAIPSTGFAAALVAIAIAWSRRRKRASDFVRQAARAKCQ